MVDFPWHKIVQQDRIPANYVRDLHALWLTSNNVVEDILHQVLVNHTHKVAVLTLGCRYSKGNRVGYDNYERNRYYRCQSTIKRAVSKFFNEEIYGDYTLLIDVISEGAYGSSEVHQTGLLLRRCGSRVSAHAFDPNNKCIANCLRLSAAAICPTVKTIYVFTTWSDNQDGLCFALTWAFFHEIFINGYDPFAWELMPLMYNVVTRKIHTVSSVDNVNRRHSSIGYQKTKNGTFNLVVLNKLEINLKKIS